MKWYQNPKNWFDLGCGFLFGYGVITPNASMIFVAICFAVGFHLVFKET